MGVDDEAKRMFGFRAEEPLAQAFDEFADDEGLKQSDALRYLVRKGLEHDDLAEIVQELERRVEELEQSSR